MANSMFPTEEERENKLIRKLESIVQDLKNTISDGQNHFLVIGVSCLLVLVLGLLFMANKFAQLISRIEGRELSNSIEQKSEPVPVKVSLSEYELLEQLFKPVSIYQTSAGSGLSVTLDTGGRPFMEVWVKSSGPAEFNLYGSTNGERWVKTDLIIINEVLGGEKSIGYFNSFRWVRVETNAQTNNEIEVSCSR